MINALFPVYLLCFFTCIKTDFILVYDGISQANRCLGKSDVLSSKYNNQSATKLHNICDFDEGMAEFDYLSYLTKKSICWSHIIFLYLNAWNVLEFPVYCIIFISMKRYFNFHGLLCSRKPFKVINF